MGIKEKWLVLKRPLKTLQGFCHALKALTFGSGLYHMAIWPCRLKTAVLELVATLLFPYLLLKQRQNNV